MGNLFSRRIESLKKGLRRSREAFSGGISRIVGGGSDREETLDEIEELLIGADLGVRTATGIVDGVRESGESLTADLVRSAIRQELISVLTAVPRPDIHITRKPHVIMMVGVNGTGKTTTIAKLAHRYGAEGKSVLLAAADTFRAAAIEQLEVWAGRLGVNVVKHKPGADAASVAYDACEAARARGVDVLIIDTAGRLQTKRNLMAEVQKIVRVVGKVVDGAPHEVLLVLDATTGQNALSQAGSFAEACGVTGIVMAKIDGTAKGGIVVAIAKEHNIPILYVGTGEKPEDLADFEPGPFVDALMGVEADGVGD
ncbi:MAG: signal recognition particle-docking protein FtsY [bacterium]